jgi:ubiquinone/menaquinone biosynthesis C-methylase UbiE
MPPPTTLIGQMFSSLEPAPHRTVRWLDARCGLSVDNVDLCAAPLGLTQGVRVVDFGCGTGRGTSVLARIAGAGGAVLGIDRNPGLLAAARRFSGIPQLRFKLTDASSTGERAHHWDVCWIDRVLTHCADPPLVIAEAARLLRAGGRLFSCELDYAGLQIDDCSQTLAEAIDIYRGAFAQPGAAAALLPWLQAVFPHARVHQQRQRFTFTTRSALLQALGVPLWLRTQAPAEPARQALLQAAFSELGARGRSGRLSAHLTVQWTLLWTARDA